MTQTRDQATPLTVLFVCTHNSARSQMAEALLRVRAGDRARAMSAGTAPTAVHPLAVEVMAELGVDLAGQYAKHVEAAPPPPDIVVTVCDHAREACPFVPARWRSLHHAFADPSAAAGDRAERIAAFRQVRDAIAAWLDTELLPLLDELTATAVVAGDKARRR